MSFLAQSRLTNRCAAADTFLRLVDEVAPGRGAMGGLGFAWHSGGGGCGSMTVLSV